MTDIIRNTFLFERNNIYNFQMLLVRLRTKVFVDLAGPLGEYV